MKKAFRIMVSLGVLAGFMAVLSGCGTVPKGATRTIEVNGVQLKAAGAGIVKADAQNLTYRIKCGVCGKQSEDIVIPTPQAGKPYTFEWVCPRCGHKQTITIQVV